MYSLIVLNSVLVKCNKFCTLNTCRKIHSSNLKQILFNKNVNPKLKTEKRSTLYYLAAAGVFAAYGYGGTVGEASGAHVEKLKKIQHREITVKFNADVASSMRWNFKPQQHEIKVMPGETALAFYTARNPSDKPVIGISTYNVVPFDAGQYFNKIQCFCFEEQLLNPHEEIPGVKL
ncbi:Cytochrome c oxidase assembly protein cox11, mitochondrial, variant 2 [Homalodisca vitripennis]|nr:Cytochrome c oxidase assembly protein cox11, mitochondrial, variant 2 [Homalodisca vitripennis]